MIHITVRGKTHTLPYDQPRSQLADWIFGIVQDKYPDMKPEEELDVSGNIEGEHIPVSHHWDWHTLKYHRLSVTEGKEQL